MLFQCIDDKENCVGIYSDQKIHYDQIPNNLTKTWSYAPYLSGKEIEYARIYCNGQDLDSVCPEHIKEEWATVNKKLKAFLKSFMLAKINLEENCFFELVPERFLHEYCEIKNEICENVFANCEKPKNHDFLVDLMDLTSNISARKLNLDMTSLKKMASSYKARQTLKKLSQASTRVSYDVFGTITGRLTTLKNSFPILTLAKSYRKVIKPRNDFFVELDYNSAEIRTFLSLLEKEIPEKDIHEWNRKNIFKEKINRRESKEKFFQWLYNPNRNNKKLESVYDRDKILEKYFDGESITTVFNRKIKCDRRKALNYVIQSTTSDVVLTQTMQIQKLLENTASHVAFCLHDSVILDLAKENRYLVPDLVRTFSETNLGSYFVNVNAGKNFGAMRKINL